MIAAGEGRPLEARDLELLGDCVGVGHRERAGTAAHVLRLLGLLEVLLDRLLRPVKPLVVELAPPDAGHQPAPGTQCAGDVAERLHRVGEEHHPHPRERVVVGTSQVADLHVGREEVDVLDPRLSRLLDRGLDEGLRDVHAGGVAFGADQGGQLLGGVAEAAADVEDPVLPRRADTAAWRRRRAPPSPATTRSRYSTKRSKRTPLQASVASSFSAATTAAETGSCLPTAAFSTRPWYGCRGPAVTHPGVIRASIAALAASALLGASSATPDAPTAPSPYQAAVHLSGKIGSRPVGEPERAPCPQYVAHQFRAAGLDVRGRPLPGPGTRALPQRDRQARPARKLPGRS